jgi:hypothetical protein
MREVAALGNRADTRTADVRECIVAKATTSREAVATAFTRISNVLQLRRDESGRCRACGEPKTIWRERPP